MKKNTAGQTIGVEMIDATDGSVFTGSVSVLVTVDGGTQTAGGGTAPTNEGTGYYSYSPTQAETNGDHIAFTFTGTGAITATVQVYTTFPQTADHTTAISTIDTSISNLNDFNPATDTVVNVTNVAVNADMRGTDNAMLAASYTAPDNAGITQAVTDIGNLNNIAATDIVSNGAITTLSGAVVNVDLVDVTTTNTDMRGTDGANTTTPPTSAAIADSVWDEALSGHNIGGTTGKAVRQMQEGTISVEGAVNDGSATNSSFVTNLASSVDDYYVDVSLVFIDGALVGQSRPVLSYNGTTKTIVLDEPLTGSPSNGDSFIIKTDHVHPIAQIADGVWNEAIADHNSVGSTGNAVNSILTDTDSTIPSLISSLNDLSAAQILEATLTESYAADGVEPTLTQAIYLIQQMLTEYSISGTAVSLKKLDGTTSAANMTLNDATNPTGITRS